ncbi:WSC-domain-containing protein [Biscogniauxia sp. FL1348]|nr:WSC-domain-containing protein [Biscogniauxia sp. FL1348]
MRAAISTRALLVFSATGVVLAAAATNFDGAIVPGLQVGDLQYLGCANEIPGRVLTGLSYSDDRMTIESCQSYCNRNNFPLSGVEYGRECYCGKWITKPAALDHQGCDMPCAGNGRQMCGGSSRMSIFNLTRFVGPSAPKTVGSWRHQSCFMEPSMGARALGTLVKADDRMTVEMCTKACQDAAYAYAGLEYGRECWCGAKPWPDLEDASDPSCAMQCDMTCGGNGMQICGGRDAITIYENTGFRKRELQGSLADVNVLRARKGRFLRVLRRHHGGGHM